MPALIEVLRGPDRPMQVCAADVLGKIGPQAREAIPALVHAVEEPGDDRYGPNLRQLAVEALGRIGPEARAAAPVLRRLLTADSFDYGVVDALEGIGEPPVREILDILLKPGKANQQIVPGMGTALVRIGPRARKAVLGL